MRSSSASFKPVREEEKSYYIINIDREGNMILMLILKANELKLIVSFKHVGEYSKIKESITLLKQKIGSSMGTKQLPLLLRNSAS